MSFPHLNVAAESSSTPQEQLDVSSARTNANGSKERRASVEITNVLNFIVDEIIAYLGTMDEAVETV
jgi:hypothetical protein